MMRYYVIISMDVPHSLESRLAHRAAHLARLHLLQEAGHLLVAGPLPAIDSDEPGPAGFMGSLIIAKFLHLDAAIHWANNDPYKLAGIYHTVSVYPFTMANLLC